MSQRVFDAPARTDQAGLQETAEVHLHVNPVICPAHSEFYPQLSTWLSEQGAGGTCDYVGSPCTLMDCVSIRARVSLEALDVQVDWVAFCEGRLSWA